MSKKVALINTEIEATESLSKRSKTGGLYQRWQKREGRMMWLGQFVHKGEKHRVGPYVTKTEAKEALEQLRLDVKRRKQVKEKITFGKFAEEFLETARLETPTTYKEYAQRLKHLMPFFNDMKLDEIRVVDIKLYRKHRLSEPNSPKPATINRELATLSRIFTVALEDEKIMYHPMSRRRLKLYEEKRPVRPLQDEERLRLQAACKLDPRFEGYEPIIITGLNTGMRLMELLTLKWGDVDPENKVITIVKAKGKRPRYIPMNDLVYRTIRGLERVDEYVFRINRSGDFRSRFEHNWVDLCKLANVKNLRFHDLRATVATKLTDNKVSIRVVQVLLGHSTSQVTERYIRVDKSLEDAVSTLSDRQKSRQNSDDDLDEDS